MAKRTKAALRTQALSEGEQPAETKPAASAEETASNGASPAADAAGDAVAAQDERPAKVAQLPLAVGIRVPLGADAPDSYVPQHLEVRLYQDAESGKVLKRLLAGLVAYGVRLAPTHRHPHGKAVSTYADAIRWLLREIALEAAEPTELEPAA